MPAVWPLSCSPVGGGRFDPVDPRERLKGLLGVTRSPGSQRSLAKAGGLGAPALGAYYNRIKDSVWCVLVYCCVIVDYYHGIILRFSYSNQCFLMLPHASRGTVFSPLSNAFNAFNASVQITTCECRYHGYQRVLCCDHGSLERAYKSYPLLSCSGLCFMYEGFRFEVVSASVHGFTAFARDHTSEPIHLQRVWTLQRSADCRPYGFLGAFFHLSFLHTVLRDSYICQTNAK